MKTLYFAQRSDSTRLVKIGVTHDVDQRLAQLGEQAKCPLVLLRREDGVERGVEGRVQRYFQDADAGLGREWFLPTTRVLTAIRHTPLSELAQDRRGRELPSRSTAMQIDGLTREERLRQERTALRQLGILNGQQIDHAIAQRGITQSEMARRLGVSRQRLSQIIRKRQGSRKTTQAIMMILRTMREDRQRAQAETQGKGADAAVPQTTTKTARTEARYLTFSVAARELRVSLTWVRTLAERGDLTEATEVVQGSARIVTAASVRKLQAKRAREEARSR